MKVILLSAGKTREGHGFSREKLPKCLYHYGGKILLQSQVDVLHEFGLTDIRIVVGWKKKLIIDYCKKNKLNVEFVVNKKWKTSALESIRVGIEDVNDDKLIILGDTCLADSTKDVFKKYLDLKGSVTREGSGHMMKVNKELDITNHLDQYMNNHMIKNQDSHELGVKMVDFFCAYCMSFHGRVLPGFIADVDTFEDTDEYKLKMYRKQMLGEPIIGYGFVVGDLLHMGHINFFKQCKKYCNYLVVGVYSDELNKKTKRESVIPFEQRFNLLKELRDIDELRRVDKDDQTYMLKKLVAQGYNLKYLFHGDDWDKVPGTEYIESIGGKLVKTKYTKWVSTTQIINRIKKMYK